MQLIACSRSLSPWPHCLSSAGVIGIFHHTSSGFLSALSHPVLIFCKCGIYIYVCVTYIYVSSLLPPCKFRCSKLGHQFGNRCLLKPSCWALVLFCWGRVSHSPGRPLTYYVDEQNLKLLVFLPPPVEQMCLSPRLAFYLTLCALVWRYQISWN